MRQSGNQHNLETGLEIPSWKRPDDGAVQIETGTPWFRPDDSPDYPTGYPLFTDRLRLVGTVLPGGSVGVTLEIRGW
jgi:hypothetical protein